MSGTGPFFLRWRPDGAVKPLLEQFATLDDALDAAESRWETLRNQAPQLLDGRQVLIVTTEEMRQEFEADRSA